MKLIKLKILKERNWNKIENCWQIHIKVSVEKWGNQLLMHQNWFWSTSSKFFLLPFINRQLDPLKKLNKKFFPYKIKPPIEIFGPLLSLFSVHGFKRNWKQGQVLNFIFIYLFPNIFPESNDNNNSLFILSY